MSDDFFARNEWDDPTRVDWHVLGLFDVSDLLEEFLARYRPVVTHRAMHPPLVQGQLHLTLVRIGDTERIAREQVLGVVDPLVSAWAGVLMPQLTLGDVWSWNGSVCARVEPRSPIVEMRAQLAAQLSAELGVETGDFVPHVTLAYPRRRSAHRVMSSRLEGCAVPPVGVDLQRIALVRQWAEPPGFRWTIERDLWRAPVLTNTG